MGSLGICDGTEKKYQLRKQEIFKAIKNNRALSGLEGFCCFYYCFVRILSFLERERELNNSHDPKLETFVQCSAVINDGFRVSSSGFMIRIFAFKKSLFSSQ